MYNLIGHATSHLARRGTEDFPQDLSGQIQAVLEQIPAWGALILLFTVIAYFVVIVLVVYTLQVIFKLAAVEEPQNAIAIPIIQGSGAPPAYKDTDPLTGEETAGGPVDEDPEVVLVQQKPITSSIRQTVRHLTSIGGPTARWRGFVYSIVFSLLLGLLSGLLGFLSPIVSGVLARIILARWEMGWTHIVISNPSSQPWYRRLPPMKTWKKIWGPTAIVAILTQCANIVPLVLFFGLQMHQIDRFNDKDFSGADVAKVFLLAFVYLVAFVALVIPAEVALTRVQASMLPEEVDAIVPFDRTFGQRVVSELEGGSGKLGFRDAWKSISKEARSRIIKLIVKAVMIVVAIYTLFIVLFGAEFALIVVPAFRRARNGDAPSDDMRLH